MTAFGRRSDGTSPRDWVRQVAQEAIRDACIGPEQVDALVVATESDFFWPQLCPGALLVDEAGLVPRPVMRVEMGGASGAMAIRAGTMHILSGMHRNVLVVGYEQAASGLPGDDVRTLYGLSFDAELEGMAGASAASLYALSAGLYMHEFGITERDLARVSVKNHGNAVLNPLSHKPMQVSIEDVLASRPVSSPYKLLDCSMISDGAAAVVLAAESFGPPRRPRVRIAGWGCASDHSRLGDRARPYAFEGKARSAHQAYEKAGITEPKREVGLAEVYDAFTGAELQGIEALGLCDAGQAARALAEGRFDRGGVLPVNLSGGLLGQGGPPGATGVAQVVTLAQVLQGRYWPGLQPGGERRFGVADAHSGVASVSVTHVLEKLP